MSGKVPERFWSLSSKVDHDVEVVRADVADEWKRQRDLAVEALRWGLERHGYLYFEEVIADCEDKR